MRILMLSWEFPPYVVGGMGKHVAELVPALAALAGTDTDLQVDVVSTRYEGGEREEQLDDHVTVYRVDTPSLDPIDMFNSVVAANEVLKEQALALGEQHAYDLIHIHDWLVGEAGVALKLGWKVPLLTTIHATERGRHQGYLTGQTSHQIHRTEWKICYEAWKIIVCSQYMASEVQDFFHVPSSKIVVIPNGVDVTPLQRKDNALAQRLLARYAPTGERLLFFVGRMVHEKGVHLIIQAMPKILEKYPSVRLLVAGKNGEKYQPLASEHGVADRVEFLGYITDAERNTLYQIVDAAIFPSLYEPFGIVALEAMAAGANVIVSDVGGLREVVENGQNGLTVLPNDPDSIVWAVDQLFKDPVSAQRRCDLARRQVETLYNWHVIARHTLDVYRQIIEERANVYWP